MSRDDLPFVSRSEWGARESREIHHMDKPVSLVFIHHTNMKSCTTLEEGCEEMRVIQNFHMDDRGWDDVGYNFLVSEAGHVFIGRDWTRVGAHTYGFNRVAIAISVMGNFTERPPSELTLQVVQNVINSGVAQGKITPDYKVYGHRDVRETECPGDKLYAVIKAWEHAGQEPPEKPAA
ncbi:peptidoglycan recognition protein 1-like [Haliotis rufescens]|uniref:peptidoglycan recognition protein 1-like n=1 Tax=Haliotis rufescens TaxID=6454 RepID=UPI00201F7A7E|nr:peptidoglycan recognition protein 1-like [Haliotis rufescens]